MPVSVLDIRSVEGVTVVVKHGDAPELRLNGLFSKTGANYETSGLVAQVDPCRGAKTPTVPGGGPPVFVLHRFPSK